MRRHVLLRPSGSVPARMGPSRFSVWRAAINASEPYDLLRSPVIPRPGDSTASRARCSLLEIGANPREPPPGIEPGPSYLQGRRTTIVHQRREGHPLRVPSSGAPVSDHRPGSSELTWNEESVGVEPTGSLATTVRLPTGWAHQCPDSPRGPASPHHDGTAQGGSRRRATDQAIDRQGCG